MANGLQPVRPGDLITARSFNDLLLKIEQLEQRLDDLAAGQGGSAVRIDGFDPQNQQRVGQELRVQGAGFAFPPTQNTVSVDGVAVTEFRLGTTPTELRFLVPPLSSIPTAGRVVAVRVANTAGSAESGYRVLPALATPTDPPVIAEVAREDGVSTLRIGQTAVITGSGFSTTLADNQIRFRSGTSVFPPEGETVAVLSAEPAEIRFTVPDFPLSTVPATGTRPFTLELTIGAHPAALHAVTVRRN